MLKNRNSVVITRKVRTGIAGFDEITGGGLPYGRATLLEGGPGCGKTVMALQTLVYGAQHGEPGIFVAFEESPHRIRANAAQLGWDLEGLENKKLFILDAQPSPELIQSGSFDLRGLLSALDAKAREIGARRIVFDAIDIVLALLPDLATARQEIYRLHAWLLERGYTAIITAKTGALYRYDINAANRPQIGFMQFMVDCAVTLSKDDIQGISQRSLHVVKYRGSGFSENTAPFLIGKNGLQVAGPGRINSVEMPAGHTRVSSGVKQLDEMLGGGYYRYASVLITGFPGTAKTTLAGAFAEAACERGDPTLFASFDTDANEIVRNLASVGIRLERFIKKGLLRVIWMRSVAGSAETHLLRIKAAAAEIKAKCVVIDPLSALSKGGNESVAHNVAERLVDWTKSSGLTMLCTSLLDESGGEVEGTPLQISTLADTWIHLSYLVNGGERNRGLSIIKSRGTAHSNQVRELVLSSRGLGLTDVYTAGGEVLAGTLRWEKEREEQAEREECREASESEQNALEIEAMELEARLKVMKLQLEAKRVQKKMLARQMAERNAETALARKRLRELRGVGQK